MSFNENPEWAKVELVDVYEKAVCPHCKQPGMDIDEAVEDIFNLSYYKPRHITPYIVFQCNNEGCSHYEEDFQLPLVVRVFVQGEVSD
jgi:hypothetical protein